LTLRRIAADPAERAEALDGARAFLATHPAALERLRTFVVFVGWPRSGHSLVGTLLNAHPDAVIAHELNALELVRAGVGREDLLGLIFEREREFAAAGRRWEGNDYSVPGSAQGATAQPLVIGDKKGGRSTVLLAEEPDLLECLGAAVALPLRVIQVLRDPPNVISSIARRRRHSLEEATEMFFAAAATNERLVAELGPALHTLALEDLVADAQAELRRLCSFLSLEAGPQYLDACARTVDPVPRSSRDGTGWTPELTAAVARRAAEYPALARYFPSGA